MGLIPRGCFAPDSERAEGGKRRGRIAGIWGWVNWLGHRDLGLGAWARSGISSQDFGFRLKTWDAEMRNRSSGISKDERRHVGCNKRSALHLPRKTRCSPPNCAERRNALRLLRPTPRFPPSPNFGYATSLKPLNRKPQTPRLTHPRNIAAASTIGREIPARYSSPLPSPRSLPCRPWTPSAFAEHARIT